MKIRRIKILHGPARISVLRIPPFCLRLYDPASNPETLARRSFPVGFFYWFATKTRRHILSGMLPAEGRYRRRFQRQLEANRDFGPLDARVFRGVFPLSLCSPHRHPRDPLISGLRGSRNEPSEARWHEEGSMGWAVGGSCSKLRYRDLATLTPLLVEPPFAALRRGSNPRLRTRHRCHKRSIFEDVASMVVSRERIEVSISKLVSR